jgi:hypothetical protein
VAQKPRTSPAQGQRNIVFFSFLGTCFHEKQAVMLSVDRFVLIFSWFLLVPPTAGLIDVSPVIELHCGRDSQVTSKSRGHHRFWFCGNWVGFDSR